MGRRIRIHREIPDEVIMDRNIRKALRVGPINKTLPVKRTILHPDDVTDKETDKQPLD